MGRVITAGADAEVALRRVYEAHARVAIVASFQAESSVIIDMASKINPSPSVLTLDTGRLPQETHDMIARIGARYGIEVQVITPDTAETNGMVATHGPDLFYESVELRRLCCDVRKSRPLDRALRGYDAWVTGVRREQTPTRADTPVFAIDVEHGGITKVAPLAGWSKAQVWNYIREHEVPYHELYDRGYTSIGCAPCTRATSAGEDERAGRWWWEQGGVKECGLHWSAGR